MSIELSFYLFSEFIDNYLEFGIVVNATLDMFKNEGGGI